MKKKVMLSLVAAICAITVSHSQSTLKSTPQADNKKPQTEQTQNAGNRKQPPAAAGQEGTTSGGTKGRPAGTKPQGTETGAQKASSKPGAVDNKNANDVGRYSNSGKEKSMLNDKEAVEKRRKNLTETDTTVKKGSGSSPRNMKNKTGKTGNYQNQQSKRDKEN